MKMKGESYHYMMCGCVFVCFMEFTLKEIVDMKNYRRVCVTIRVSLEVLDDGVTPKPPAESWNDNLPKLYIDSGAFMKVLGGKLDVKINSETGDLIPLLFDREGNEMDPNA